MSKPMIGVIVAAALAAVTATGCGQNRGYLVRPVPVNQQLEETVVASDPGLLVTDKIALLDVDGVIFNARDESVFGPSENPVSFFVEKLDKAAADEEVRAVVVRINSPGGTVTATDIMYQRLRSFRERREIPVIAAIEDVGASGGYYLACGCDTIIAQPTSVTGSIGTVLHALDVSGAMRALRIRVHAIASGPHKDMGSPFARLSPEDRRIFQEMIDEFYQRFVDAVAAGRDDLTREQVAELADGRIYTGTQAKERGLVDRLGAVGDAIVLAKQRAGVARAKVVMYHRPLGYRANVYSQTRRVAPEGAQPLIRIDTREVLSQLQPQFLYLWSGRSGE